MSFDWKEYLNIARRLQKSTDDYAGNNVGLFEACCRSAVSRAYYAAYHTSLKFAEENLGYIRPGVSCHADLKIFLNGKEDIECKKLSRVLGRLCQSRVNCDYDDNLPEKLEDTVKNSISDTEEIFNIIDRDK